MEKIRHPIVTVAGHVDHGKTSILDKLRGTSIQEKESGGITQKISLTKISKEKIKNLCGEILKKFNIPLEIPGLFLIDTPGHAAFANLRKRGGSLADIAILVIDINEGIKPQTQEVIQILRSNKTPFIIALNKIDNIRGWKPDKSLLFMNSVKNQALNVKQDFEEKLYTLMGALQNHGLESDIYLKITDFSKKVAIVPCSAKTSEGIAEILAVLTALSQKFLKERITLSQNPKGIVLEIKKEETGTYLESLLYDGEIKISDALMIGSLDEPIETKIRSLKALDESGKKFAQTKKATAAEGLIIQIASKEEVLPGMPFRVLNENKSEIKKELSEEISSEVYTDKEGILVKADSLGSLEAVLLLLRQKGIKVAKIGIGPITKKDIYTAKSLPEENRTILGFNVGLSKDAVKDENVKIIKNDVVYRLIEDFEEWKKEKELEIEKRKLNSLPKVSKIIVLDFVFRNSNPAIFGVKVEAGTLKKDSRLINRDDEKIGYVKEMQENKKNIQEAKESSEVAISVPGLNFERQLKAGEALYTNISESDFRNFKKNKNLLTSGEKEVLQEIAQIKRRKNPNWGI